MGCQGACTAKDVEWHWGNTVLVKLTVSFHGKTSGNVRNRGEIPRHNSGLLWIWPQTIKMSLKSFLFPFLLFSPQKPALTSSANKGWGHKLCCLSPARPFPLVSCFLLPSSSCYYIFSFCFSSNPSLLSCCSLISSFSDSITNMF